jgi:hypothetical protein
MAGSEDTTDPAVRRFIDRWLGSGAAERANYQLFLSELCDVLGVPRPDPATPDTSANAYVFERAVDFTDGAGRTSTGRIDLYKRACLVLEAKQGSEAPPAADQPALSEEMRALRANLKRGTAQRGTQAWDAAMLRAKGQGDQYIRALPAAEVTAQ